MPANTGGESREGLSAISCRLGCRLTFSLDQPVTAGSSLTISLTLWEISRKKRSSRFAINPEHWPNPVGDTPSVMAKLGLTMSYRRVAWSRP